MRARFVPGSTAHDAPSTAPRDRRAGWIGALLIAGVYFAAVAPTLSWLQLAAGLENLVVSTVLELRRGEPGTTWLVPTLEGEPRTGKPPLTTWITSLFVRDATVRAIDNPDPARRAAAYTMLAREVRLSALLSVCAMLMATYALGAAMARGDGEPHATRVLTGAFAAATCATTLYVLRFGRQATTDVQLALWVTVANALLARMLIVRVTWGASIACGAALGMALMSKGPVALLQSVVPATIFAVLARSRARREILSQAARSRTWPVLLAGAVVMLVVGGAWYAVVLSRVPGVWWQWFSEVTRVGATDDDADNPLTYLAIVGYLMPWTPYVAVGAVDAWRRFRRDRSSTPGSFLALVTVVVPLLVMSFFPDRKERYLLPLAAPASALAARGLIEAARAGRGLAWLWALQWIVFVGLALGVPLAGATVLRKIDGQSAWYSLPVAATAAVAGLAIVGAGILACRRVSGRAPPLPDGRGSSVVTTGFVLMLFVHAFAMLGYRDSRDGRSEMRPLAEAIRAEFPDAEMYNWRRDGRRKRIAPDLSIYMNRVTRWTADPAALPPSSRPRILVTVHSPKREAREPRPPPGWRFFGRAARDDDWYVAFVRDPPAR